MVALVQIFGFLWPTLSSDCSVLEEARPSAKQNIDTDKEWARLIFWSTIKLPHSEMFEQLQPVLSQSNAAHDFCVNILVWEHVEDMCSNTGESTISSPSEIPGKLDNSAQVWIVSFWFNAWCMCTHAVIGSVFWRSDKPDFLMILILICLK